MAYLDYVEGFEAIKGEVTKAVKDVFPIVGKRHTLRLEDVTVKDNVEADDVEKQKEARLAGRTLAVPVEAKVSLVDNATGKIVDSKTVRLLSLPKLTNRYSYIINGVENQIDNQWRLKSGVYARLKESGELQSNFNLKKGANFNIEFDPKTRQFVMAYGNSHIPLLPVLRELGIPHEEIEKRWGKEIVDANAADSQKALAKFFRSRMGKSPSNIEEARKHLIDTFDKTELRPDTTKITLGKEYTKVTGETLLDAATKLLRISQGKDRLDDRDSIVFKELHSAEDFLAERIRKSATDIHRKIKNTLDTKTSVNEIVSPNFFNAPIEDFFRTSLASKPRQINPLEMISGQMKTTITGPGGIQNVHEIATEAKLIDNSHLGFLDPLHTPEGADTGVALRLSMGMKKDGHTAKIKVFNVKTNKYEFVSPTDIMMHHVALPDQVRWINDKPVPVSSAVKASAAGTNEIKEVPFKDVTYIYLEPTQMFSVSSNLIPFLPADHPNRSTMAGRHMEQAISLVHRAAPIVRAALGMGKGISVDKFVGTSVGHTSPVDGVVAKITKDAIYIKDKDNVQHKVSLYDHYPLNDDKSFLHSTPLVKVGDKVKKQQAIADTNYTKDGVLALGTNLRVGYMPFKGLNFEDGVVISETASKLLTSEHLHRYSLPIDSDHVLSLKKYLAYNAGKITKEQAENLDEDGVVKPGTVVKPGDPLIVALKKKELTSEDKDLMKLHKSLVRPYADTSVHWDSDYPGVVQEVVKRGRQISVHVKTQEPAQVGDKVAGRHGNKGIITAIIPDHEMPKTADGPLHILMNPTGVPGRTNLGQVLEVAASKVALKTGEPYMVKNFEPGVDLHAKVEADLKKHGIPDKEPVYDGVTGRKLGDALVGVQHIIKLHHQVEKKLSARGGGVGYAYDSNLIPKGGGEHGAQSLGSLGLYAMLAHGAKANLREMQTYKSDAEQGDAFWAALQAGEPLPAPRPTFAYKKFIAYLNALGLNVVKTGNNLQLLPFTDRQVRAMSKGALPNPALMFQAKNMKPEAGGLFDPKLTGGEGGKHWTHIELPEPFPNPVFEAPILSLLDIREEDLRDILAGKKGFDPELRAVVPPHKAFVGGYAIKEGLHYINVKKELKAAMEELSNPNLKGNRLDRVNRKIKYLRALEAANIHPEEAYIMHVVPVLPPIFRPVSVLPDGTLNTDDVNNIYKGIGLLAHSLKNTSNLLPQEEKGDLRLDLYDGLKSLAGLGGNMNRQFRGILDVIGGKRSDTESDQKTGQPKYGFFQDKLVKRKQDLSMRSTIIPNPDLSLDEVGLPKEAALEIYKPFIVRELKAMANMTPLEAQNEIKKGTSLVDRALERVMAGRPVLLKRDPVLHKYGVQAFKPRIVGGKAVQIHPLVTAGYNADFDGDTMSAFVPVSHEAVMEAYKMLPSNNLFNPASGSVMYTPTQEAMLGLYGITKVGNKTDHKFKDMEELEAALRKGQVKLNDQVTVGAITNGVGRFLVASALPEPLRGPFLSSTEPLDKKRQHELLTKIAKDHPHEYPIVVNKLKDLGNKWSTETAFSIGLDDIRPYKDIRKEILGAAAKAVASLKITDPKQRDAKIVEIYDRATKLMHDILATKGEHESSLITMNRAGIKPTTDTLRQIKLAPMLIMNAKGEIIPMPVTKSYAEGLDFSDYWVSMSGARKGIIQKVQSVQEPGYITKLIVNTAMDQLIVDHDCGTNKGIALSVDDKDILDRHLAVDHKAGDHVFKAGTLVTPEVRNALRNAKVGKVIVRSPLRCLHGPGICQKCFGLAENGKHPEIGTNVGVLASQALGERATQLAMKSFHTGGTAAGASGLVEEFDKVQQLLLLPKKLPGSATLSTVSGTVEKIEKDPAGGHNVYINGVRHYVPHDRGIPHYEGQPLKVGMEVKKGAPISKGPVNPHEMLPLTGMEAVQLHLADELNKVYASEGIRRRNHEIIVKAMTGITQVVDPGSYTKFIRGDIVPTALVAKLNKSLPEGSKPIIHQPVLRGVKMLPLEMHEDWIARLNAERLHESVLEAAQKGWVSNIHGQHPIPAVVYGAEFGKGSKAHEY